MDLYNANINNSVVYNPTTTTYPSQELRFQGVSGPDFIAMRLNMSRYELALQELELLNVYSDVDAMVAVIVRTPKGVAVLQDGIGLFPSDGLITQLRLMMKS